MKSEKLLEAIGGIDDNLIYAATNDALKRKKSVWMKWGAIAACLCLVVAVAIPIVNFLSEYQADDPDWRKTHYETSALSEIEAICGTDLLIDQVAQAGKGFRNYQLEIVENGSFDNKDDWKSLTIEVNYGESLLDSSGDSILCFISFDGNTDSIYTEDYLKEATTANINGYIVEYQEASTDELAAEGINYGHEQSYHGWARFTHNGYTYYFTTDSNNADFFTEAINQLLG